MNNWLLKCAIIFHLFFFFGPFRSSLSLDFLLELFKFLIMLIYIPTEGDTEALFVQFSSVQLNSTLCVNHMYMCMLKNPDVSTDRPSRVKQGNLETWALD